MLQFGPLQLHAHHVIPQANGHLSMRSLTDVETVHREETRVSLSHLVNRLDFQHGYISLCLWMLVWIHLYVSVTYSNMRDEGIV